MRKLLRVVLIGILILTAACGAFVIKNEGQEKNKEQSIFSLISNVVQTYHYNQLEINDDYSEKAFNEFLSSIDRGKRFLLQEDVDALEKYSLQFDEQYKNASLEAFEVYNSIMPEREKYAFEIVEKILAKPLKIDRDEFIQTNSDSLQYCTSKKELKERWEDYLTFAVIDKMFQIQKKHERDSTKEMLSEKEMEKEAREDILERHQDWFKRLSQLERSDRFALFSNAFLAVYDPHTQYFPPKEKEDFDISFSGKLEGIGAMLQVKDGYIKVSEIIPGSASWRQGELKAGDVILEVAQGDKEPVDVVDMRLDKAVRLIRGPKGTEVRLTVKKVDGEITIIPIIRDVVVIEETYAKSLLIQEKEDSVKYGYISLESFYADFNDPKGRRSGIDVLNELKALKAEGAEGVILDLRNNGGGSLGDAVEMVGHFITQGPVVQVDGVDQAPEVYEDEDSRVYFSKPLVVLVNNFSASASEIFAAAIQDYERGVVVGINTFGKGTVQRFIDLDRLARSSSAKAYMPTGSIKMTMAKFYRINGGATQLKGVQPDIVLPEAYMNIEVGEKEYDFALPWSSIKPAKYNKIGHDYSISSLAFNSKNRVDTSLFFSKIYEEAKHIQEVRNNSVYPLSFEQYVAYKNDLEKKNETFEMKLEAIQDWRVEMHQEDKLRAVSDEEYNSRLNDFIKKIEKDRYIREALNIIQEM
jgi:carboxyl-terminal processing protease